MNDSATQTGTARSAWAWGLATTHQSGQTLDAWYPAPELGQIDSHQQPPAMLRAARQVDDIRGVEIEIVRTQIDLDAPPTNTADAYLRLHLLSHRLVKPRTINLDGIFNVLPNVVWTTAGPCQGETFETIRGTLRGRHGGLVVQSVDKFPRMIDYVVPSGVRISDGARVRLGAYLAEGTTVMHEGFCNFNAGTLGTSMVEGRISQGVIVGDGSDIGGGASIMGTLSGGGREQISIGRGCLLGAESGLGICLGDNCVVEAGLYLTAGTKVGLPNGQVVKAVNLSGASNILYLRDSQSGAVVAKDRSGKGFCLNTELHKN